MYSFILNGLDQILEEMENKHFSDRNLSKQMIIEDYKNVEKSSNALK